MRKLSLLIMALFFTLTLSVLLVPATFADNSETVSVKVIRGEGEITTVTYGGELGSSTTIDLDSLVADGYEFLFYIHNGSIVDDKENEFVVSKSNKIIAVLEKADEPVTVYIDSNGDLLGFGFGENPEEPANIPAKPGLVFHSFAEHKDSPKVLVAQYDRKNKEDAIEITVIGGTNSPEEPLYNDLVELTPTNPEQFSYWADEDGQVVSTNPNYVISALKPVTLEAVYDEDFVAKPSVYLFNVSGIYEGKQSFLGHVNLVDGYELVEYGLLVSTDVKVLTFENATKLVSSAMSPAHEFLRSLDEGAYKSFRGYAIFKGTDGLVTVYSENNFAISNQSFDFDFTGITSSSSGYSVGTFTFKELNSNTDFYAQKQEAQVATGSNDHAGKGGIIVMRGNQSTPSYVEFDFGVTIYDFEFSLAVWSNADFGRMNQLSTFTLQGWNGIEWIDIDDYKDIIKASATDYEVHTENVGYSKVRLYITKSGNGDLRFVIDDVSASGNVDSKLYTVIYHHDDETTLQEHFYGNHLQALPITKNGYTLEGWYTTPTFEEGTKHNFDNVLTGNLVLYANFVPNTYVATINLDGGIISEVYDPIEYVFGTPLVKPVDPVKPGYTFAGWYLNDTNTPYTWWDGTRYGDHTITAKWTVNQYEIVADSNGGSSIPSVLADYNSLVEESYFDVPTRDGFTFMGWFMDINGEDPVEWPILVPIGGLTIYAGWQENQTEVTITFDANGGTGTPPTPIVGEPGQTVILPVNTFIKTNHTFVGWNTQSDGSGERYLENENYVLPGINAVLYAEWESTLEDIVITVIYGNDKYAGNSTGQNGDKTFNSNVHVEYGVNVSSSTAYWESGNNALRLGSSKNTGTITYEFENDVNITSVIVYARQYDGTVKLSVNSFTQSVTNSDGSDFVQYTFELNSATNVIEIKSVKDSKYRVQIEKVEFVISQ